MCDKDAKYCRYTQFSGNYPYCKEHAKLQSDFKKSDSSYFFWDKIKKGSRKNG